MVAHLGYDFVKGGQVSGALAALKYFLRTRRLAVQKLSKDYSHFCG